MDAVGSAIRVDSRGREVMRILPRVNEAMNEEWISDKTRHVVDGLRLQRLDRPFVRDDGRLRPATWREAFAAIAAAREGHASRTASAPSRAISRRVEEMFALKLLMQSLGVAEHRLPPGRHALLIPAHGRASYLFNSTIAGIEDADAILIVGANPRIEASLVNVRIRKRWRMAPLPIGLIGERVDLTYAYDYLGAGPETLADVAGRPARLRREAARREAPAHHRRAGRSRAAGRRWRSSSLAAQLARAIGAVTDGWNGFSVLHTAAARVGALDLGFVPGEGGLTARQMAAGRRRRAVQSRRRRDRDRAGRLRDLPGHAWRPRRAPRRRDPAGRGLHREVRHLRQHRRPGADRQPRRLRRRATRARTGRSCAPSRTCSASRLPFDSLSALRQKLYAEHPHFAALDAIAPSDVARRRAGPGRTSAATPGREPFVGPVARLLSDEPDRPRLAASWPNARALARGARLEAAE